MKYNSAIISLFTLSVFAIVTLLYLGNLSRKIEKENIVLKEKINFIQDQININEIEYNLLSSYNYLKKLQLIYFDDKNIYSLDNRISFNNLKKKNIKNIYTVGTK
jgi:hypothetical protein